MSSSSTVGPPKPAEVEAILDKAARAANAPLDTDLLPVFSFLLPSAAALVGQTDSAPTFPPLPPNTHWYCSRAASDLHREAATFLIFLFAYRRNSASRYWVDSLETVVSGCNRCARGFGAARRELGRKWLSRFPARNITRFFEVIDTWQAKIIVAELDRSQAASTAGLLALPASFLQLFLNEPTLLSTSGIVLGANGAPSNSELAASIERLSAALDTAVSGSNVNGPSIASSLGLNPVMVALLSSPEITRRQWALNQIELMTRAIAFDEWSESGIGTEVQNLFLAAHPGGIVEQWRSMKVLIDERRLKVDTVQKGLLEGLYEAGTPARADRSVMSYIARLLGSPSDTFPLVFKCFTNLLSISPTHHIWAFNTSPELPHTLFSDIKRNTAFQAIVLEAHPTSIVDGKRPETLDTSATPLLWIVDYLVSAVDSEKENSTVVRGFSEALAKAINFCFSDMQHESLKVPARAAAAEAGCQALATLQTRIKTGDSALKCLSSTVEVHAAFIASTAFQRRGDPQWAMPRAAGIIVLSEVFAADGRDIVESVLGLATIAFHERRRLKKKRRSAAVPDPVRVETLHKVSIRRELWTMAYNALSPTDPEGLAVMTSAVAAFAHIEPLDRGNAWNPSDLKEVVNADDWVASVRAINSGLKVSRERFGTAVESVAASPDPSVLQSLWKLDQVPRAVMTLLLSPADGIHEPMISLIQPSFEDVDDRGDCFRALLERFPHPSMEGLCQFLSVFIQTASRVPEACSLAKWLVRCFTDVLEVLCQPSGSSPPLLQSEAFLSSFSDGKWMTRRVDALWQLMTDSLALIFKRTADWAPYYDNDVMVDWMRDALIFGRGITDNIRIFESAILSRTKTVAEDSGAAKMTRVGKGLVQKLEVVLADLVGWLRLTDLETLHQTYELIKTILGRISRSKPDLSKDSALVTTLLELDKFCHRASSSYNCRLSDDLLSELSELLDEFDLPERDEEIQASKPTSDAPSRSVSKAPVRSTSGTPTPPPPKASSSAAKQARQKNAFEMMMNKAGGSYVASPAKAKEQKPKVRQMTLQEFEDDSMLDNLSAGDLDILERRAQHSAKLKKQPTTSSSKPAAPSSKLHINVVPPKMYPTKPASSSKFKSSFFKDIESEHKAQVREMKAASTTAPRLPTASRLGTGLGAYTGPPKPAPKKVPEPETDSSASDSDSDAENKGVGALLRQVKALPQRPAVPERRSIKILGGPSYGDAVRERENARQKAHFTKMRLRPDITPLIRYVLAWDPSVRTPRPPYPPKVAAELGMPRKVPGAFATAQEYEKTMLPLFLQELWAQFIKDDNQVPPITVEANYRAYEDDFIDIDVVVVGAIPVRFGSVNDTDIVTIRTLDGGKPIFAKVQVFRRKFKESAIKLRILGSMDQKTIQHKTKLVLQKHASLSTAIREFASLKGLPYYDQFLLRDILASHSATMPSLSAQEVQDAMHSYQVNEPQAKAILGALSVKGFALIQGPPGTGKTKTISGMVGKFLAERKAIISVNGQGPSLSKILVCAPSNAAIDEVCKRLMDGVLTPSGKRILPKIVRIGVESSVNVAVKNVSLDNIVEARVNAQAGGKDSGSELARVQAELEEVKNLIKEKQDELANVRGNDELRRKLEGEFHTLNARRTKLGHQTSKAKDAARDATRHLDGARRAAREAVLSEADVVCATLSGSGQDILNQYTFETVIIDEAAQAIEMSCLIPLKYGCQRCIMVGDPNQLPPTTFSVEAEQNKYNQSLFVRIAEQKGSHMHLLNIQYRMHPDISELPSNIFYQGRLKDGPDMASKTAAVWHQRKAFGPYRFFNVDGHEVKAGTSTKNPDEARVAADLYRNLTAQFGDEVNFTMRIGIITMYREQMNEIRRTFTDAFGPDILETIDFNTVDGFQGQEKDIIILSCVRSGPNLKTIGFLKDFRRMNVALTRAKSSLFVIGNAPTLERSDSWKSIVKDARDRNFLVDYKPGLFQARKDEPKKAVRREPSPDASQGRIPKVGSQPKKRPSTTATDLPPEKRAKVSPASSAANSPASARSGYVPRPPAGPPPTIPPPPPSNLPPSLNTLSNPGSGAGPSNAGSSSAGPSRLGPLPRPLPPGAPPGRMVRAPGARPIPRQPRLPPPRPEDVLFMRKKPPPGPPPPGGAPPPGNVRQAMNQHLAGGRRQ